MNRTSYVLAVVLLAATRGALAGPTTTVANTAANPVPVRQVDNPALQPFSKQTVMSLGDGDGGQSVLVAEVPAGKTLVIETVDVSATAPVGEKMSFNLHICQLADFCNDGTQDFHSIPVTYEGDFLGAGHFSANHPVRYYVGPGREMRANANRSDSTGSALVFFNISGHLVDTP